MKHKYYDMIVAKAANTDLIQFIKINKVWERVGSRDGETVNFSSGYEYFLCLPKHKEACLHWLNGGNVEGVHKEYPPRVLDDYGTFEWSYESTFMKESVEIRILPKKEKRWIGYCANTNQTFPHPQKGKEAAEDYAMRNYNYKIEKWQFLEIEIGVEV